MSMPMRFCSACGSEVSLSRPDPGGPARYLCGECNEVHYVNPIILVACYLCVGKEILWIRRGIEPAAGLWALPGGYMEVGETPEAAVARELAEETGVRLDPEQFTLVSVSTLIHMAQTHLVFRCHLPRKPEGSPSEEAVEIGWFDEQGLPWEKMAFPAIAPHVRQLYEWLASGGFGIRIGVIDKERSDYRTYLLSS